MSDPEFQRKRAEMHRAMMGARAFAPYSAVRIAVDIAIEHGVSPEKFREHHDHVRNEFLSGDLKDAPVLNRIVYGDPWFAPMIDAYLRRQSKGS
ncbi:MAG: hypothetical protein KDB26_05730 [Microthrixaceae bacterium]|nr:hypothetical protein [Microthrixaceae bacterium]